MQDDLHPIFILTPTTVCLTNAKSHTAKLQFSYFFVKKRLTFSLLQFPVPKYLRQNSFEGTVLACNKESEERDVRQAAEHNVKVGREKNKKTIDTQYCTPVQFEDIQ